MRVPVFVCVLLSVFVAARFAQSGEGGANEVKIDAHWNGSLLVAKYKNREFIVGIKKEALSEFPLVGTRTLAQSVFTDAAFPMTIQEQESYVVYDRTQQKTIVYNIALCLKGKDKDTNEKTDWVGAITPAGNQFQGDIIVVRKYDKKGGAMRAPYYSMGRDYPMTITDDGTCKVSYSYFGEVVLKRTSLEVPTSMLSRIVDDFDKHYSVRDNTAP